MKKKVFGFITTVLAAAMLLSGCSGSSGNDGNASSGGNSGSASASGDGWKPSSTVTIYCVSAAGGATDYCDRAMAQALGDYWGATVQVVNQPGGSGGVAAGTVWNNAHDGMSILGFSEAVFSQRAMGVFDQAPTAWDLMPVMNTTAVLSVPAGSPYANIDDLIAASKSKTINMASGTGGSVWSLKASLFADAAGITFNRLNYEGSVPSQTAALSGEVEYVVTGLSEQLEYILAGKLVPLAMIETEPAEIEGFGTIPAITDALPSFADYKQPLQCIGLAIPNDCPDDVRAAYEEAFKACMESDTVKTALADGNYNTLGLYGEEAQALAAEQEQVYSWALFDAEVAPEDPSQFGIGHP